MHGISANRARQRGVTLIELLIALVIVGILTAVALPGYQRYQERTYVAQAMTDLGVCAQAMERFYTVNFTYAGAVAGAAGSTCLAASPPRGTQLYTVSIQSADNVSFTIRATPLAATAAADAPILELDSTGVRWMDLDDDGNPREAGEDSWEF